MHWTDTRTETVRRPKDLIARALDVEAVAAIREPEIDELGILRHMIPPQIRGGPRRPPLVEAAVVLRDQQPALRFDGFPPQGDV